MNKPEFLDNLNRERKTWEDTLAGIDEKDMTKAVLPDGWSVKDIMAHVVWHEREMTEMLEAHALVGSDWWNLPMG